MKKNKLKKLSRRWTRENENRCKQLSERIRSEDYGDEREEKRFVKLTKRHKAYQPPSGYKPYVTKRTASMQGTTTPTTRHEVQTINGKRFVVFRGVPQKSMNQMFGDSWLKLPQPGGKRWLPAVLECQLLD